MPLLPFSRMLAVSLLTHGGLPHQKAGSISKADCGVTSLLSYMAVKSRIYKNPFKFALAIASKYRILTIFEGKNSASIKMDIPTAKRLAKDLISR